MKKILTLFAMLLVASSMAVGQTTTWTVAGSNTTLLGTSWDTGSTANDMINVKYNEWYLLKANKTLTADNNFKYKVAKNHTWSEAYPGLDKSFPLTAGTYDVLFKFDSNSKDVSEAKVTSWTVAGTADVFGSDWSTGDTNNDMARSGNNWTLTKSHVLLAVGTIYDCKVAANHAWTYAFPGDNKDFTVAEDGYYDVTVNFNTSTLAVTVTTTFIEPAVPPTPIITLHSNITGSWATSDNFAIASGDATASLTMNNVAVGSYEFVVKINNNWTSNGASFTRANPSRVVESGSGNCTFVADVAGNFTFTWTYETNTLAITYPNMVTKEVKFFAPRTEDNPWDNVYAFVWNGDVLYSAAWPGDEITSTKNSGWYKYDVPVGANVLFTDYAGTNGDARMQTADITNITADACYVPTAIDYQASPKVVTVAADADCKVEYHIAGSKTLVGGTTDFGSNVALDENNQIKFENVAAGEYAFKINIGNWFWALGGNDHLMGGECASIAKTVGQGDVGFAIDHTQDVTITYYPATQKICLGAETTKSTASVSVEDMAVYVGKARTIPATKTGDAEQIEYEIISGSEYINIADGKITGVAAGTATVRASVAETATYLGASTEFTVTVAALQTAKVKFFAPRTEDNPWNNVYAYAWIGGDAQSAAWPGDEITSTKSSGWYEYDVPVGASVLFTDNNTTKGVMKTTDILNVTTAKSYVSTSIYYPEDPDEDKIVTVTEQNTVTYHIAGSKNLIEGEAEEGFDVNLPLDENNQIVFQNVEPGTYAFKINNGTWAWSIGGIDHMKAGDCASIAKEVGIGDLGFKIDTKQDVTVTYYPATQEICLGAETVKADASVSVDDTTVYEDWTRTINVTKTGDGENISYDILEGDDFISIVNGRITGVAEGTATVKVTLAETETYKGATDTFMVTVEPIANATFYLKNNWQGEETCDWTWKAMTADGEGQFRLENVVYGGSGLNYNVFGDDDGAQWVDYAAIKYADNKVVAAYDTVNFVLNPATGVIMAESRSKDVAVYTLAGSELALFSQGWAPTHLYKYTDMEKQSDGKYKWTNLDEMATLCKGPIEYKVIKDRAYENGSWPEGEGNNFVLNVLRGGEYEIAIYFDPCSKTSWVDTTLVKEIDVRNLILKGDDDWTTGHPFTRSENNDRASVTLSLTASENPYEFKLYENGDYWYGDGQAFTRENPAIRDIVIPVGVEEPANMTLQVDKDGDYLFTYIFETKELVVSYPAKVPETKIAPLSGEFSIGPAATTGRMSNKIRFSRGNLQYNFDEQVWYTAENQYESLGDLNLRFGDNTYKGSVDLFDWSCESSNFGLLASNVNTDYTGDFKDWGQKFAEDANDWFTLSQPEWNYLLSRKKDNKSLWSVMGLAVGPDTVNVFALFPDDWTAPSGVTINYGFYDVDDEAQLKENSFSEEKWEAMEEAGAVFLPLAGARAGWWGNKVGIDGATLVNSPMNPLANNSYCWVDGGEWYGYYWTSTIANSVDVKTAVMPAWHNNQMTGPQYWSRARRYGQSVRLVTRVPREPDYVRGGEEHPEELPAGQYGTICLPNGGELDGATIYELAYYDASASKIFLDEVLNGTMVAGTPYIFFPEGDEPKIEVYYTDAENADARQNVNGLYGSYEKTLLTPNEGNYILYNNQYWLVNSEAYVGANRAYLKVDNISTTKTSAPANRRRVAMGVNGKQTPTGVDEIQGENVRSAKVLINGRLYILRGEKMYDATGRQVK